MAATSPSDHDARPVPRQLRRYVAVGDSFTAGVPGNPEGAGRWPDLLADALGARHPDVEYVNLGVAGATSPEVAAGQLDRAATLEPDLVTVLCGANDVLLSVRPDIDGYRKTFGAILARLGADAPEARVLTATCADFSPWLPMGPRSRRRVAEGLAALNEVTREVAAAHDVVCLDFAGHPHAGDRGNYAADGVHPSREGNERAASAFAEAVAELAGDARAPDHQPDGGP